MMRTIQLFGTSLLLFLVTGCFTMNATLPGTLRSDVEEKRIEKVGSFEKEVNHWFIPFGLGEAPSDAFQRALLEETQAKGADGVAKLELEAYFSCTDILLRHVIYCIVMPRTYKLSGDLVRIKKPPLPGKKPKGAPQGDAKKGQVTVEAPSPYAQAC